MLRSFALILTMAASVFAADTQNYFFGFLKSAPGRVALPKDEAAKLQAAHLAHLGAMNKTGGLVAAGPLANGGELRGVIVYRTATLDEALANANADPMVKAGQLVTELYPWTGPAGIGEEFKRTYKEGDPMKLAKHVLLLTKPGASFSAGKTLMSGPYRDGGQTGQIHVFPALNAEERKALEGDHVRVLLDWYVSEGVLPAPAR